MQDLDYTALVGDDKRIAELITALHHTRRPDAMSILRTGLGVRFAVYTAHVAARPLRKTSPGALLAAWMTSLATSALDTIQLDFLSLSDPAVVHSWAKTKPALAALAVLQAHGQAADPEMAEFCSTSSACAGFPLEAISASNEQIHLDAQLCLYALAQLYMREDRPVDIEADSSDSRQVHAALTTLAYRIAEFSAENWSKALGNFLTLGWDDALVNGLCQADTPEHFPACAQVLRHFRARLVVVDHGQQQQQKTNNDGERKRQRTPENVEMQQSSND